VSILIEDRYVKDESGQVVGLRSTMQDITGRKRAEQALKESEEKFSRVFHSNPHPMSLVTLEEGSYLDVNDSYVQTFGFSRKELLGRTSVEMGIIEAETARKKILQALGKKQAVKNLDVELYTKSGRRVNALLSGDKMEINGRTCLLCVISDITERKKMEQELRESEEKLNAVVNSAGANIHMLDKDCNIIWTNQASRNMYGEDIIGRKCYEAFHQLKEPCQPFPCPTFQALRDGKTREWENKVINKDGQMVYVNVVSSVALRDEEGNPQAVVEINRDITDRKKAGEALKESEERYRALVNLGANIGEAVVMLQDDERGAGMHTFVNEEWTHITGYSEEELLNISMSDIIHPRDREEALVRHRKRIRGEELSGLYELSIIRKDGTEVPVEVTFAHSNYKGKPANVGYIRDITDRKQMEEALQKKMEELENAYSELQKIDEMKDSFLSTVSHELRTPLTSIKGFAEILLSYEEDRETQKEFLNIINEESERLTRLIDDLLDLARLESGRQEWVTDRIAITDIITQAVHAVHSLVTQKRLNIQTDLASDLPYYAGDKDRLIQVVTNLLSNAIKFTPEEGEIKVKAELVKDTQSKKPVEAIRVSVSDTGIGIEAKNQEAVFERFKQVGDTMTDKPKGTGLGLPICKEIVEYYKGRMWVESEPGKGSTFYFTLPLDKKVKAEAPEPQEIREAVAPKVGKTILVVDDEDHVRRFLSHEFTKRGYRVFEATNGHEAISLAREQLPDLITLDVLMPEIDGYDATAILKNDEETKDIPILIISVIEDKQKAFHLGANDYLTKPFKIGMVMEKISKLLRKAQKTVLVVDDDKALVKSLKYKLEKRGISTYVAYNGKEALQVVHQTPPNLILLDIIMPEMDGYEVMSRLKRNQKTAPIPVIVLTGVEIDGGRVKALSLGADDYVTKSDGLNKLFENIETYISDH
jgi:PAS domain S-box-containing protein